MIAPELLSNEELERLAYQSGNELMMELARRVVDDHGEDEYDDLEKQIDDAEERAAKASEDVEELSSLCCDVAEALRKDDAEKWADLIKKLEAA